MYRIGIDLGGTNIAAGLVNEKYEIVCKESTPTEAHTRTGEEIAVAIAELCKRVCAAKGVTLSEVEAIGVASPGIVDHTNGVVEYSNNLPFRHFMIAIKVKTKSFFGNIRTFLFRFRAKHFS